MGIEQRFENDPTDQGLAWVGERTVSEVREDLRAAAREEAADPGPPARAASASHRRRVLAQLARERGWSRAQSRAFNVPCEQHAARPGEWCRIAGRRRPGQVCGARSVVASVSG